MANTPQEQADQDLAMRWTAETHPTWRNVYDLIRAIRAEEQQRQYAEIKATACMAKGHTNG